ncbi:hypothetical protein THAOC_06427, partial [Thalassiosira oceanica]
LRGVPGLWRPCSSTDARAVVGRRQGPATGVLPTGTARGWRAGGGEPAVRETAETLPKVCGPKVADLPMAAASLPVGETATMEPPDFGDSSSDSDSDDEVLVEEEPAPKSPGQAKKKRKKP